MRRIKIVVLTLCLTVVMCSQTWAVTYAPNKNDNIVVDRVEALEDETVTYTQEDVEKVLNFYKDSSGVTKEEFEKYDLNGDGYVNSIDASMMLDRM